MPSEQELERRWEQLYGEFSRVKQGMLPAYNAAIAPKLAGLFDFYGKSRLRVLVVAGGTGVFSKNLLQPVLKILKQRGSKAREIDVVETDYSPVIAKTPASVKRVRADVRRLPFADGSFDVVIGQSMIHELGPPELEHGLGEIKRVLTQDGSFLHVHDVPPPQEWANSVFSYVLSPFKHLFRVFDQRQVPAILPHLGVYTQLNLKAHQQGLKMEGFEVDGRAEVSSGHKLGYFRGQDLDKANDIHMCTAGMRGISRAAMKKGTKKLRYTGVVSILSKHPEFGKLISHVRKF